MTKFGIGDEAFAMSILRNDLYSDPVKAIVQEYISNARDAHRDAKRISKPIEVHLPHTSESWFSVRDYGNGISPENMDGIFVQYCVSTKRDDEDLDKDIPTGGFGIGAKSAWANHKEFFVTSITDKKRKYRCYLIENDDGTSDGFIEPILEEETTEPSGVEIFINISEENACETNKDSWSEDYFNYENSYVRTTHFWSIQPKLVGIKNSVRYPTTAPVLSGEGWWIYGKDASVINGPSVIVDGIPYPIDTNQFKDIKGSILSKNVYISFDAKTIPVAPNREQLRYSKNCKNLITSALLKIRENLQTQLQKEIDSYDDFKSAVHFFNNYHNRSLICQICGGFKWKEHTIPTETMEGVYSWNDDVEINHCTKDNLNVITINRESNIPYNDTPVYYNDSEIKPSKARLKKLFADNPSWKSIYVVKFNTTEEKDRFEKKFKFDIYKNGNMSEVEKLRSNSIRSSSGNSEKVEPFTIIKLVDGDYIETEKVKVKLKNLKGKIFVRINRNKIIMNENTDDELITEINSNLFKNTLKIFKIKKVYGIPERFLKSAIKHDMINICEYMRTKLSELLTPEIFSTYFYYTNYTSSVFKRADLNHQKFANIAKDNNLYNSPLISWVDESEKIEKDWHVNVGIFEAVQNFFYKEFNDKYDEYLKESKHTIVNIKKLKNEVDERYPLLPHINLGYYSNVADKKIVDYINMCDKLYMENKK